MSEPRKNVYIFVGPPGSGKGTLSHLCIKTLGWVQLSTGNLCRKHIAEGTEIGRQIDFALKSGKLVSDNLINDMVQEWLVQEISKTDNIILDGYPRTMRQASALHGFLQEKVPGISVKVIRLSISEKVVISRICGRLVCQNKECQEVYSLYSEARMPALQMKCDRCGTLLGRRSDDEIIAVQDRLQTYYRHEQDLLNFYAQGPFVQRELSAEKQLDEVFEDFKKLVGISNV